MLLADLRLLLLDRAGVGFPSDDPLVVGLGRHQLASHLLDLVDGIDQLGFQHRHPVLEGPRVDLEQEISLLDGLVFLDVDPDHLAFDPGGHLDDEGLNEGVRGERRVAI